jgi:hypothetical protein
MLAYQKLRRGAAAHLQASETAPEEDDVLPKVKTEPPPPALPRPPVATQPPQPAQSGQQVPMAQPKQPSLPVAAPQQTVPPRPPVASAPAAMKWNSALKGSVPTNEVQTMEQKGVATLPGVKTLEQKGVFMPPTAGRDDLVKRYTTPEETQQAQDFKDGRIAPNTTKNQNATMLMRGERTLQAQPAGSYRMPGSGLSSFSSGSHLSFGQNAQAEQGAAPDETEMNAQGQMPQSRSQAAAPPVAAPLDAGTRSAQGTPPVTAQPALTDAGRRQAAIAENLKLREQHGRQRQDQLLGQGAEQARQQTQQAAQLQPFQQRLEAARQADAALAGAPVRYEKRNGGLVSIQSDASGAEKELPVDPGNTQEMAKGADWMRQRDSASAELAAAGAAHAPLAAGAQGLKDQGQKMAKNLVEENRQEQALQQRMQHGASGAEGPPPAFSPTAADRQLLARMEAEGHPMAATSHSPVSGQAGPSHPSNAHEHAGCDDGWHPRQRCQGHPGGSEGCTRSVHGKHGRDRPEERDRHPPGRRHAGTALEPLRGQRPRCHL